MSLVGSDPVGLAEALALQVRAGPPVDCFTSERHSELCCCAEDGWEGACWHYLENWHQCCAHLEVDCGGAHAVAPRPSPQEEALCWHENRTLRSPAPETDYVYVPPSWDLCCDTFYGPRGMKSCWEEAAGEGFSFERCCGALWEEHRTAGCTAGVLQEAWAYFADDTGLTYRELWQSSALASLRRYGRQVLSGRPEARLTAAGLPCLFAFVTTQALAFSKLPWDVQWQILADPLEGFKVDSTCRSVILAFDALFRIPLRGLVVDGGDWALQLLDVLIRHSRKLRNYLAPQAQPYPSWGGFPRSDAGMAPEAGRLCELLWLQLNRGGAVLPADVGEFLGPVRVNGQLRPAHRVFAAVMAHLALAHSILWHWGSGVEALAALESAGTAFEEFVGDDSWRFDGSHLFFTAWPFWPLLRRLGELWKSRATDTLAASTGPSLDAVNRKDGSFENGGLLAVYCGDLKLDVAPGFGVELLAVRPSPRRGCRDVLLELLRSSQAVGATWIALLSPLLMGWRQDRDTRSLRHTANFLWGRGLKVAGFPAADADGWWHWPVRKIRHAFWRLRYEPYPTGYGLALGWCAGGDSTSATRVYSADFLLGLVAEIGPDPEDVDALSFFVELDLLAFARNVPAYTCTTPPIREKASYLLHAPLTEELGRRFHVELAEFWPRGELEAPHEALAVASGDGSRRTVCGNASLAQTYSEERYRENWNLASNGMATRYCWRRDMQRAVQRLVGWWLALDPERHVVLPIQGTLLTALVRNGEVAAMPWDLDFEFALASTGANPVYEACRLTARRTGAQWSAHWDDSASCAVRYVRRALGRSLGEVKLSEGNYVSREMFRQGGVLSKVRMSVGLLDLHFEDFTETDELYRARLFGGEVQFAWRQWEYQLFEIYSADLRKKVGTAGNINISSACSPESPHGACLEDPCGRAEATALQGCTLEVPDLFAHVVPT